MLTESYITSARQAVLHAIASVTGGAWLSEELLRHAAQLNAVPLTWGVPEMQSVLDGMVDAKLISTEAGRYFVYGGVLIAGQVG